MVWYLPSTHFPHDRPPVRKRYRVSRRLSTALTCDHRVPISRRIHDGWYESRHAVVVVARFSMVFPRQMVTRALLAVGFRRPFHCPVVAVTTVTTRPFRFTDRCPRTGVLRPNAEQRRRSSSWKNSEKRRRRRSRARNCSSYRPRWTGDWLCAARGETALPDRFRAVCRCL